MAAELFYRARQSMFVRISGRCAYDHLHRYQLLCHDLAIVHPAIAKRDVDTVRREIGGTVFQHEVDFDVRKRGVEPMEQRCDDPAAESARRADAQLAARRTMPKFAHVIERLDNSLDAQMA